MRIHVGGLGPRVAAGLLGLASSSAWSAVVAAAPQDPVVAAEGSVERVVRVGDTVEGEVTAESEVVHSPGLDGGSTDAPVRGVRFALEVETAGPVTVDLRSYAFDAYLVLLDAEGRVIAEDDDGLIGTQSRIVVSLEPGRYSVVGCALPGGVGPFTLDVRSGEAARLEGPQRGAAEIEDARMVVAAREAVDPNAPETARALNSLAVLLYSQGRYPEAEPLHLRALEIREATLGENHIETSQSVNNLALLYSSQGRYSEAEPLFRRVLETAEAVLGEDHVSTATSLNNLAYLYQSQGRYSEAEPLQLRALRIHEAVLGEEHTETATVLNNLAVQYYSQGRYSEAEPFYRRALKIWEATLGENHPLTATSLDNLAALYASQGRYLEAEPLYLRALGIREKVLGEVHPDTATSLNKLAGLYVSQGLYSDAERFQRRALEIQEAVLGESHPDTARSLSNLAVLYQSQGRYSEAEPLHLHALEIRQAVLGEDHPQTAQSLESLASLYQFQGRHAEAEPLHLRALEIREAALGEDHPVTAVTLHNLAALYCSQGRYSEAEPLSLRSLRIREAVLGEDHPDTAAGLNSLAYLCQSQGRYEEAEPLFLRALEIREAVLGKDHPDTATSLENLAALYGPLGRYEEAEPLYLRALAIWKAVLGEDRPRTALSLSNLAGLCESLGRYEEALARHLDSLRCGQSWVESELLLAASDRRLSIADTQTDTVSRAVSAWSAHPDPKPDFDAVYRGISAWKGVAFRNTTRISRRVSEAVETDPELRRLRSELLNLEGQLSVLAYAERIDAADAHLKKLAELRERRSRVQREMQARLGLEPERQTTDGAELARVLPRGGVVLDFLTHRRWNPRVIEDGEITQTALWDEPRMLCVVTTSGAAEPLLVDLGDAARLREATDAWLDQVLPGRRGASAMVTDGPPPGEIVRELLFDPILAELPADTTHLFLIPDDFLGSVPFGALPFGEGQHLIDAVDVVYATDPVSLRDLLESTPDPIAGAPSILAVGGVDYDARGEENYAVDPRTLARAELRAGPTTFARRWDPLASTREEVEGLVARAKRTWPDAETPVFLMGEAATEEAVKSAAPGRMILHFATHGFFQREGLRSVWEAALERAHEPAARRGLGMLMNSPDRRGRADSFAAGMPALEGEAPGMLAGLILAGANLDPTRDPDRDDGVLTATEVSSLDLSACRVAVLSACQTSLGLRRSGEGLQSLRRGFHEAGARSVVASLWKVDDAATQQLMHAFYEELWTNGCGAGEALRRAKQALKREGKGPEAWGAFTLSGEWR